MPFLNEEEEVQRTIDSIYQTANPDRFEIIVIDDCSQKISKISERREIKIIRNVERMGVDFCRQMGADMATTPFLFICDSHMRFPNGWLNKVIDCINREKNTLWCTMCMGLGYGNMDLARSRDKYRGADIVFHNGSNEILEPKWRNSTENGEYEIPCVLGANYGVSKEWFDYIHGIRGLKMWGSSEMFMSLKTWMAGGACKINTDIRIGHKFRKSAPYSTASWNMIYNKIFICKTILPENLGNYLIDKIPKNTNLKRAENAISMDSIYIQQEKD